MDPDAPEWDSPKDPGEGDDGGGGSPGGVDPGVPHQSANPAYRPGGGPPGGPAPAPSWLVAPTPRATAAGTGVRPPADPWAGPAPTAPPTNTSPAPHGAPADPLPPSPVTAGGMAGRSGASWAGGYSGAATFPPGPPPGPPGYRPPSAPGAPADPAGPRARRGAGLVGLLAAALVGALVAVVVAVPLARTAGERAAPEPASPALRITGGELDISALINRAAPSVVLVRTGGTPTNPLSGGAGSGIVISDEGLVLTNAHVVGNATSVEVVLFDGEVRRAVLVGSEPSEDVAVLAMDEPPGDLVPAVLGSSADVRVGDDVVAIGNALNLGDTPSVTKGIVSGKERVIQAGGGLELRSLLQTDAAINPGNSGGPLLNARGEVVGVNTAIISNAENVGFAIAIDAVKPLIDEITSGGGAVRGDQAFLGVTTVAVTDLVDAIRVEFDITAESGVFITDVVPDSAAGDSGLRTGDVIRRINGQSVRTSADVGTIIRSLEPGDRVTVEVESSGATSEVEVELRAREDSGG